MMKLVLECSQAAFMLEKCGWVQDHEHKGQADLQTRLDVIGEGDKAEFVQRP